MSLAKGLSILFIFSKNQLQILLSFPFFVSILFISALIFMISFLLLTSGFVCSSFSNCFRCKVRLFILRDFILFDAIINGIDFLISLSAQQIFVH